MKRLLLIAAAALMFLSTVGIPVLHADGGPTTNCGGNSICKP